MGEGEEIENRNVENLQAYPKNDLLLFTSLKYFTFYKNGSITSIKIAAFA